MEIDPLKMVADDSSLDLDLTLRLEPPSNSEEESIHSTMEIDPSKMPTDNSSLDLDLTLRLEPPSNNEGESIQSTMPHIFFDPVQKATKLLAVRDVTPSDDEKQRSCKECGVTNTPTWRKGPDGPKTLCNKCGLRHSRALRNAAEDWQLEVEHNYQPTARRTRYSTSGEF